MIWSGVELATTIIAASIPHLRFALKEASIRSEAYQAGGHQLGDPSRQRLEGITKQINEGTAIESTGRHDDRSDKSMLDDTRDDARDIVQTSLTEVEYSCRADEES